MHVLIIGSEGQLGADLCSVWSDARVSRADIAGNSPRLDVRDGGAVWDMIQGLRPDVVVNAAASHELIACDKNPGEAFAVNATGALWTAKACAACGARLVYISTDYVFGGAPLHPRRPYIESDLPAPMNVYAASKLAGESLTAAYCADSLVLRTAALYGLTPCRGKGGRNFVETMLDLAAGGKEIKVVEDEITTPTYTASLARQVRILAEGAAPGLYHATCAGMCSWYEFAQAIFEETGTLASITAVGSADYHSPVRRPRYSVLENRRSRELGQDVMPSWRDALKEYAAARHGRDGAAARSCL